MKYAGLDGMIIDWMETKESQEAHELTKIYFRGHTPSKNIPIFLPRQFDGRENDFEALNFINYI